MKKVRLTVGIFKALKPLPAGKRQYLFDAATPGLCVLVTDRGPQSWYCYRKLSGRPIRYRLAGFDEVTIEQARKLASDALVKIAGGIDLQAQRQAERHGDTLAELFTDYLEKYAKLQKKESSWRGDQWLFDHYLADLAKTSVKKIDEGTVERLHRKIGADHGPYAANRALSLLSTMFRKRGRFFGFPKWFTPTAGVERFPEHARDRIIEGDELVKFLAAIESEENDTLRDFFKMLLFTGARKANVLAMKWSDISLQRGEWKIEGEETKNGKPLRVPLVPAAVDLLKLRSDATPFVFPSKLLTSEIVDEARRRAKAGESTRAIARNLAISQSAVMRAADPTFTAPPAGHLREPAPAWRRLLKRANLPANIRIHDVRRTWVSAMIQAGANVAIVAAAAGHKTVETTMKHYAIAGGDDVRKAVGAGVAAMFRGAAEVQTAKAG